jgi:hypothetical protein
MTEAPSMRQFRVLLAAAVTDALRCLRAGLDEKRSVSQEYNWPTLAWTRNNGMPTLWSTPFSGPPDYTSLFGGALGAPAPASDPTDASQAFQRLQDLVFADETLLQRIAGQGGEPSDERPSLSRFYVRFMPQAVASRYVSLFETTDFDDARFEALWQELVPTVYQTHLSFSLWIPILFLRFSFKDLSISETASIVRIPDELHLARSAVKAYGPGVHDSVLECATHALVLEGWTAPVDSRVQIQQLLSSADAYPKDDIERFFGALRVVTGHPTGYCQLLVEPTNWAVDWRADLPPLYGTSVRSYPGFFEDYYWLTEHLPELDMAEASACGSVFRGLAAADENSMKIAITRLNRCYCRDDEEDWLLDATIALEALLLDDQPQEMTHKLAMRAAVVSQFVPGQTQSAAEVFRDIKAVYKFRSAVVHGGHAKDKVRVISASQQEPLQTSEVARHHLRGVLRALVDHPELRSGDSIDSLLLSRATELNTEADESA